MFLSNTPPQRIPQVLNSALHHWAESMVSFARHSEERPGFDGVREQRSRWGGPTSSGEFDVGGVDGEVLRLRDGDGNGRERDDDAGLTHGEVCGAEWDVSNRFRRCNEGLANVAAGYGGRRSRPCANEDGFYGSWRAIDDACPVLERERLQWEGRWWLG